jgi:hypothetical protein
VSTSLVSLSHPRVASAKPQYLVEAAGSGWRGGKKGGKGYDIRGSGNESTVTVLLYT